MAHEFLRIGIKYLRRTLWILATTLLLGAVQARQAWEVGGLQKTQINSIPAAEFARMIKDFSEEGGYFRRAGLRGHGTRGQRL